MLLEVLALPAPEAVKVWPPAVMSVVLKVVVPDVRGRLPGFTAYGSVVTTLTVLGLLDVLTFPYWSTALTVTAKGDPAVTVKGLVVLRAAGGPFSRPW